MTEKEMLKLEEDNYTTMHLHLVGIFWRAYQRSALGFCKKIRPYKINERSNKRHHTMIYYLGFPASALQEIVSAKEYNQVDDTHITLSMEYVSDEEVATDLPKYSDYTKNVSVSTKDNFIFDLKEQIQTFRLHNTTPLECMDFIARLQKQLSCDGAI